MELYNWQKEIIEHKGNTAVRGGRQSGKSWAIAYRMKKLIEQYPGSKHLITSPSEKQELYLYEKLLSLFKEKDFKKKPTLKHAVFKNGTHVWKFPVGKTGLLIEGLSSVDFLWVDEAKSMTQRSIDAIIPMLAEPRKRGLGWINLSGTTFGKCSGYFYDAFKPESNFKTWHVASWDQEHIDKQFLEEEKKRLGDTLYKIIYGGEFIETDYKWFGIKLIESCMTIKEWKLNKNYDPRKRYVLGIDPAGFGRNLASFVVGEIYENNINIIYKENYKKTSVPELIKIAKNLNSKFHFSKFFIDGLGLGRGFADLMKENFKSKVRELNNSSSGKEGKILKEDLYSNAKALMESGRCKIIWDLEIKESLESVEFDGKLFSGNKTDTAEAFVRACWGTKEIGYRPRII